MERGGMEREGGEENGVIKRVKVEIEIWGSEVRKRGVREGGGGVGEVVNMVVGEKGSW